MGDAKTLRNLNPKKRNTLLEEESDCNWLSSYMKKYIRSKQKRRKNGKGN